MFETYLNLKYSYRDASKTYLLLSEFSVWRERLFDWPPASDPVFCTYKNNDIVNKNPKDMIKHQANIKAYYERIIGVNGDNV